MIALGQVSTLVLMHKDRLLRFGADIVFELCKLNQTEVVILEENQASSIENRLVSDVIELMTVFRRGYMAPVHIRTENSLYNILTICQFIVILAP